MTGGRLRGHELWQPSDSILELHALAAPSGFFDDLDPDGAGVAWSPRTVMVPVTVGRPECFLQNFAGGRASHDNHGADGDVLKDHRHTFVLGIFGHGLGLRAEVVEEVCWR